MLCDPSAVSRDWKQGVSAFSSCLDSTANSFSLGVVQVSSCAHSVPGRPGGLHRAQLAHSLPCPSLPLLLHCFPKSPGTSCRSGAVAQHGVCAQPRGSRDNWCCRKLKTALQFLRAGFQRGTTVMECCGTSHLTNLGQDERASLRLFPFLQGVLKLWQVFERSSSYTQCSFGMSFLGLRLILQMISLYLRVAESHKCLICKQRELFRAAPVFCPTLSDCTSPVQLLAGSIQEKQL